MSTDTIQELELGFYESLPAEEYHALPYLNASRIEDFLHTPARARWFMDHPKPRTKAMETGTILHMAILEPDRFSETCHLLVGDGRTTAFKTAKEMMLKDGLIPVSQDDWDFVTAARDGILKTKAFADLLDKVDVTEYSALGMIDGVRTKARADGLSRAFQFIIDIKATRNASYEPFRRQLDGLGIHRRAAFYIDTFASLGLENFGYVLLPIDNSPPYEIGTPRIVSSKAIDLGRKQYKEALERYKACVETDTWPGHQDGVEMFDLPDWTYRASEKEEEEEDSDRG